MSTKQISALIKQEVERPLPAVEENNSVIATTQDTQLVKLEPTSEGLFDESKALWEEFVAFDQEHQLTQRVGAQLWRLAKAVGKPLLVLSLKGIQTAVVTGVNADKRAALVERFSRFSSTQKTNAVLEETED